MPWEVMTHAVLDSTNSEARRLLNRGFSGRAAIVAHSQSAGRGRKDRIWESFGQQGLWASLIIKVARPVEELPRATLVLATAVREAVAEAAGVNLQIKWPNDLLAEDGRKCCGLLLETGGMPENDASVPLILGIGININQTAEDFSPALRTRATSLRIIAGRTFCREDLLRAVLACVDRAFTIWNKKGFAPARQAWLDANCTLGREIILPGEGDSRATALGLDEDGALLASDSLGRALRIDCGEIMFSI